MIDREIIEKKIDLVGENEKAKKAMAFIASFIVVFSGEKERDFWQN